MQEGELIAQAARDLNDAFPDRELTTYPLESLRWYLREALRIIREFSPKDLQIKKTVKLQEGAYQDASKELSSISEVVSIGGKPVRKLSKGIASRFTKTVPLPECADTLPSSYYADGSPRFMVNPPVLEKDLPLEAEVLGVPAEDDELELTARAAPAVLQWILYRAMAVDAESMASVSGAQGHLQQFYTLCRIKNASDIYARLGDPLSPQAAANVQILRALGLAGRTV